MFPECTSFSVTSEPNPKRSTKVPGQRPCRWISRFCWRPPFPPPPRAQRVEGRAARLRVCAWWELLNYCGMFSIIPHISASARGLEATCTRGRWCPRPSPRWLAEPLGGTDRPGWSWSSPGRGNSSKLGASRLPGARTLGLA